MNIETLIKVEFIVLLAGTIYAWYNWYLVLVGKCKTCSVLVHDNPFTSKCFWGAVFFTLALVVNVLMFFV
jgi:hypothetical protein